MAVLWIGLAIASLLIGFVGCVVPVLPGPPLGYLALLLLSIAHKWQALSRRTLIVMGILAVVVTVLDYVLPVVFSRKAGASKAATVGSVVGMLAGIFLFPPFGVIIGALLGAILGELVFNPKSERPLRTGWWVFVGTLVALTAKLGYMGVAAYFLFSRIAG